MLLVTMKKIIVTQVKKKERKYSWIKCAEKKSSNQSIRWFFFVSFHFILFFPRCCCCWQLLADATSHSSPFIVFPIRSLALQRFFFASSRRCWWWWGGLLNGSSVKKAILGKKRKKRNGRQLVRNRNRRPSCRKKALKNEKKINRLQRVEKNCPPSPPNKAKKRKNCKKKWIQSKQRYEILKCDLRQRSVEMNLDRKILS